MKERAGAWMCQPNEYTEPFRRNVTNFYAEVYAIQLNFYRVVYRIMLRTSCPEKRGHMCV